MNIINIKLGDLLIVAEIPPVQNTLMWQKKYVAHRASLISVQHFSLLTSHHCTLFQSSQLSQSVEIILMKCNVVRHAILIDKEVSP